MDIYMGFQSMMATSNMLAGAEELEGAYVYQYKDHLGNIRLSYTDANGDGSITVSSDPNQTEIVKESNYYPFGLKHKGYNGGVSSLGNSVANRFMFGGKESSEELDLNTYDFGARNYDSALGRWMNLDPLAELMRRHSPYNYAFNNPVYYIDPDGMAPIDNSGLDYDATTSRDEKYGETTVDLRKTRSLKPWRFAASSRDDDWSNDESDDSEESSPEGDEEDCCEDEVNGLLKGIGQGLIDLSVTTNPVYNTINEISKLFIQGGLIPEIEVSEGELPTYIVGAVILAIIEPGPGGEAKWLLKGLKNPKKIVVIGEDMLERVIPFAKKNGFKYFKPRGKNPANWMKNQKQWIYRQIKDPNTEIIDIGPKGSKPVSKYYKAELKAVKKIKP